MIKQYIIFILLFLTLDNLAQNKNPSYKTTDTIINGDNYFLKTWQNLNSDIKYIECYDKKDSILSCSYTLVKNKLTGIKNYYNKFGYIYKVESFFEGLHIGNTKDYYNNGKLRFNGNYQYTGTKDIFTDIICIEESSGIGLISCELDSYSSPKQGKWTYYSDNGKIYAEGFYINNKKTGIWIIYDPLTGAVEKKENY